jgi:glycosyltransferase involved in cell wall biosynthesis
MPQMREGDLQLPLRRTMKARIVLLSTSLGMGGADRQVLHLARALLAHDYAVHLVSMTPLEEMGRQALADGLPIVSLEMKRGQADRRAFQQLVRLLRSWKPHLLTSFMYHANLLGRLAGRWAGVPLIVTSIRSEQTGSAGRDWLMKSTNWMDQCCTTNSEQVASALTTRGLLRRDKVKVIPNGVDVDAFASAPELRCRVRGEQKLADSEFVWLAVGRLLPQKDYATLLAAFQPLADAPARLLIAGRGPLLESLQQQIQQLGISSQVTFLGVRDDVRELLAAADGFVLSSAWEGMPNVVMEAQAAGKPVVATHVGGVAELVENEKSGFLVPSRNSDALSQAMRRLMMLTGEQRQQMGMRGRDHVIANYSVDAMADQWMALYRELLMTKGAP